MPVRLKKFLINLIPLKKIRKKLRLKNRHYFLFCPEYPESHVSREANLHNPENIKMGKNVYIGKNVNIYAEGGLVLEDNATLAANVTILTTAHNFKQASALPFDKKGFLQEVYLEKNVWIGSNSLILAGVKIEEGAVVAAGSVVTKSVPKCAVIGGNPAKIIGWRNIKEYDRLEREQKYFQCDGIEWERVSGYKKYMEK